MDLKRTNRSVKRAWAILVAAGLAVPSGCQPAIPPEATSADQAASIDRTFAPADRSTASMLVFLADVVVTGPGLLVPTHGTTRPTMADIRHTPGTPLGGGAAVVVDRRGYFATAAHVVGPDPILILLPVSDAGNVRPARVVYRGTGGFDFAVLYAPGPALELRWVTSDSLAVGTPFVGAGMGFPADRPTAGFLAQAHAGHLLRVDTESGPDGPYLRLVSSLPAHHGDSGGPQFAFPADRKRRGLAAVSVAIPRLPGGELQTIAIRPDLDWLHRVIEDHQRLLTAAGPTTNP